MQRESAPYVGDRDLGFCVIVVTIAGAQQNEQSASLGSTEPAVSRCLSRHLRATDIFFRYKGDQYVIIHRRIDSGDGEMLARRFKLAIEELSHELRLERTLRGHVMLANMPDDGDSLDELMVAAKRDAERDVDRKSNQIGRWPESIH